ncbi:MAG TPA: 2-dehydro-3-deoxygalactonokinase, partial [Rhodopila sp.]|nr:2-dehydro-3-deoxygalactonokinase [Rhodopila sp.]
MPDESGPQAQLIALDWGTSSLRAYLIGGSGRILDRRTEPWGIMQVPAGEFAARFDTITSSWRARWPRLPALAAGMIGSAQGWVEAPYCPCPAGPAELATRLVTVPNASLCIVPGVVQGGAGAVDARPDVMRGEETQIAGALALRPMLHRESRLVMPGTHCKWVDIKDGRIARFTTYMTGEVFAVLRQHSILGRLAGADTPPATPDSPAFLRGVDAARDARNGVAPLLFSARALVLAGRMPASDSLDYLSGLLIGDELRNALQPWAGMAAEAGLKL